MFRKPAIPEHARPRDGDSTLETHARASHTPRKTHVSPRAKAARVVGCSAGMMAMRPGFVFPAGYCSFLEETEEEAQVRSGLVLAFGSRLSGGGRRHAISRLSLKAEGDFTWSGGESPGLRRSSQLRQQPAFLRDPGAFFRPPYYTFTLVYPIPFPLQPPRPTRVPIPIVRSLGHPSQTSYMPFVFPDTTR
nr:hypothetical protein CFP56_07609 [Quercus suber]